MKMGTQHRKLQPLLQVKELEIGYKRTADGHKKVAGPLNLEMYAGQLVCLLGPNGCGKSTLLRSIAGLQPVLNGYIEVEGQRLDQLQPAHIAKIISLVLTDNVRSGNLDVYSLIALGRYPHTGWLGTLSKKDKEIIDLAIQSTHTAAFLPRKLDSLSDGECQKVMLARALAQDTPLVILDEPTAHLDLPSRIQLMGLLHQLAREMNKAILISTHELDLALQAADEIWLMSDGDLTTGLPEELVLNGSFQQAFDKEGILFDTSTGTFNLHHKGTKQIRIQGEGKVVFWTKRALVRMGYEILTGETDVSLTVKEEEGEVVWSVDHKGEVKLYRQLPELLDALSVM
ncbi:ABC transporter ATP-binding protein [Pedobacter sp. AW31-3R]|uniref:ABC transporter ATP-binding protein n=1 Tax=Pedobacter sp. AW31-3R TaxID=3445781 RepID=UPI003FA10071